MWMSELAERSGLPVATVKFYLREGLLAPGELTGATRARYDDSHVQRLRLIRALAEVGGLSLTAVRDVLNHIDHGPTSLHDRLGAVHSPLAARGGAADGESLAGADRLLDHLGWSPHPDSADR